MVAIYNVSGNMNSHEAKKMIEYDEEIKVSSCGDNVGIGKGWGAGWGFCDACNMETFHYGFVGTIERKEVRGSICTQCGEYEDDRDAQ